MNIYSTASFALLCAAPVVLVSCSARTAQDTLDEEAALIAATIDLLEATTEENTDEILAKLEKLGAQREEIFNYRKTLSEEEVQNAYFSEKTQERLDALSKRLCDEVGPKFNEIAQNAQDVTGLQKVCDIVMDYCYLLPGLAPAPQEAE